MSFRTLVTRSPGIFAKLPLALISTAKERPYDGDISFS
jgi:hypothetical protein